MGKSDRKKTQSAIDRSTSSLYDQYDSGIHDTQDRLNKTQDRSDTEHQDVYDRFKGFSDTGGVDPADKARILDIYAKMGGDSEALRKFASTGGVSPEELARINRPIYEEFEKTGGYSDYDKANIRGRANSPIAAAYANTKNNMDINNMVRGQAGPGMSGANFKLLRQGAQQMGENSRDTEVDLNNAIREGRMGAADRISGNQLALSDLKGRNTLAGYTGASNIDSSRAAGDSALMQMIQQGKLQGTKGMLDTYGVGNQEMQHNQDLLNQYRNQLANNSNNLINSRINASNIPGLSSTINSGLGVVRNVAGTFGSVMTGGLTGMR